MRVLYILKLHVRCTGTRVLLSAVSTLNAFSILQKIKYLRRDGTRANRNMKTAPKYELPRQKSKDLKTLCVYSAFSDLCLMAHHSAITILRIIITIQSADRKTTNGTEMQLLPTHWRIIEYCV